jgi:hypothetical protein
MHMSQLMKLTRYRLSRPTLGVHSANGKPCCMTVPTDATIEIPLDGIFNDHRTIEVRWEDYVLTMFSEDVRERSVALDNTDPELSRYRAVNARAIFRDR